MCPTNSIWVRDYGPWFVLLPDGQQGIFNYTYDMPRPLDNNFPVVTGSTWGIPVYTSTIVHAGGNYMSSGFDQAMSTHRVYIENGGNEDWVDSQMALYLGIDNYIVMDDPQGSYINHIDCWAKMLSPDRILVLQVPPSHPDYAALEAVADMLALTPSPYGTLWNVYRVQSSGSEGYTNSLISNDHVYIPVFNSINDAPAIAAYQEALPGYTVEGFFYGPWLPTDALHCRTRNVIDNEMLLVQHVPVDSLQIASSPVTINALIRCHPDNSLLDHDLNYRIGTSGVFTTLPMAGASADSFSVNIPGVPDGETVQYYISAADNSGREESQPRFAPSTWFFEYETTFTGIGEGEIPAGIFALNRVSPNPFSSSLSLDYSAAAPVTVVFSVYDIAGRTVARR
ncbi:MAG: agmatine deiminase family protein, partial [Candidatus Fermentibacteraceae bacterium]|nr:agmatine deiminase family protein [Candidatus Fermentibacteraceae bacterium]